MSSRAILALVAAALLLFTAACTDGALTETRPQPNAAGPSRDLGIIIITLPQLTDFVEITAGGSHTCARQFRGYVYCWGYNGVGQVGTVGSDPGGCSGFQCVIQPTFVTMANSVDAGDAHTCSLNAGRAQCWGMGSGGRLGNSTGNNEFTPTLVSGTQTFSSISAGVASTCATSSSGMFCWGQMNGASVPTQLFPYNGYTDVVVGSHACAMSIVGSVQEVNCWGQNASGQTTQDPATYPTVPSTMGTMFGSTVSRVAAAGDFTCVDQQSGIVQCAGTNQYGQLGNGRIPAAPNPTWTNIPQSVVFPPPPCTSFFCKSKLFPAQLHGVTAGWTHACALDANGAAYCWGLGSSGQLGNGGNGSSAWPVAVAGGHTYRSIAAGAQHTCAIGRDNVIYCWGDGIAGQLGTGLHSDASSVPKPTGVLRPWITPTV